jgi:hypothetical protein
MKAIKVKQTAAIKILKAARVRGEKLSRAMETLINEAPQIAERMINNSQLIKPGLWIVGFSILFPIIDIRGNILPKAQ